MLRYQVTSGGGYTGANRSTQTTPPPPHTDQSAVWETKPSFLEDFLDLSARIVRGSEVLKEHLKSLSFPDEHQEEMLIRRHGLVPDVLPWWIQALI